MKNYTDLQRIVLERLAERYGKGTYEDFREEYISTSKKLGELKKEYNTETAKLRAEQNVICEALKTAKLLYEKKIKKSRDLYRSLQIKMAEAKLRNDYTGGEVPFSVEDNENILYKIGDVVEYQGDNYVVLDGYWTADRQMEHTAYLYRLRKVRELGGFYG